MVPVKLAGVIPTTVTGLLLTVMTRPTAAGSLPSRLRQNASLTTATGGADGWSSSSVIRRPASGVRRSTRK
jgi:hypothetical protein